MTEQKMFNILNHFTKLQLIILVTVRNFVTWSHIYNLQYFHVVIISGSVTTLISIKTNYFLINI